ncbi:MAG: OmpA family protein [Clostridium sp.]|nr:OmpA family protein [Prevotella sp.]MCM1378152.1 OmpA family protein [Prevotella sp.]MCM1428914.1 OmpA family protein [Clostridium sp.]MCM1475293.1 OmpA family protein [Muribaculaceae bacterium]
MKILRRNSSIRGFAALAVAILTLLCVASACKSAKLSDADAQMDRGEFFDASKTYRKIYNKLTKREERPLRGEVAYKMATCYRRLNMAARASAAYQNAIRYQYPDSMAYFYLGRSLQAEGKYAPAIEAYQTFLQWKPENTLAREGIRGCQQAIDSKNKKKTRYVVKNAKLFNSRRSDFSPMYLDKSLDQIYFTSTNEKVTGTNRSEITGMKKGDIYFSKKNERGEWQRPEPAGGELNTDMDEGIISFSPDGQTMYLTKARRSLTSNTSVEIFTSRRSDATWSVPQKFEITADTLSAFGHPAVSPDGRYLYFSSDMPGGYGGKDIWRINLQDKGGSLENMGPQINTAGDEMFPYMRTDSVMYFSSDGHPGFGGLDLFRAYLDSTGKRWSIDNMGLPMNSSGDDFGITFGEGESGFFSSNRGDGRGYDHIYSFELPDIKVTISGWVVDKDDEPVPKAIIRIVGDDGSNQKEVARDDGSFSFNLERGTKYVMMAGAPGYLNQKQEFVSDSEEEDAEYGIDFILAAIDKPQVVENIFYDFDKATLRPESKKALDEMAQMLRDNPNVSIEMGSHTDRMGSDEYNLVLSDRRAKSVVDYLVAAGVDPARLTFKGYGETVPKTVTKRINKLYPQFPEGTVLDEAFIETLSEEDRQAADQINRRTEFKVTSINQVF